ncbi:unnamed protein product [Linum trigynum]|uniref:KIB1-4 beta-propeller domain-containing protein n=1 Tax=Linum trigynum TaxID=586398 RepID=A0AAV2CTF9_9ROSI
MAYCVHPAEDVDQQLVTPLLYEPNLASDKEICERRRRAWEDLSPDLLNTIYAKLPTYIDGTEFGSVCRNWRQIHCAAALSTPLPLTVGRFNSISSVSKDSVIRFSIKSLGLAIKAAGARRETWMDTGRIPGFKEGRDLACHRKTIVGSAGSWWLLVQEEVKPRPKRGDIEYCFNPLLRSPANLIALPPLSTCSLLAADYDPSRVRAAFSALPTAPDCTIVVVHPPRRFSTLRRGQRVWRCYEFGGIGVLDCIGIGYRDGKFLCLFQNGELLIFSAVEEGERRMLTPASTLAPPPLLPANLHRVDNYLLVADSESGFLRVSWGRVDESKNIFRLLTVEKETEALSRNDDEAVARLEKGPPHVWSVYLNAQIPVKRRWGRNFLTRCWRFIVCKCFT